MIKKKVSGKIINNSGRKLKYDMVRQECPLFE